MAMRIILKDVKAMKHVALSGFLVSTLIYITYSQDAQILFHF